MTMEAGAAARRVEAGVVNSIRIGRAAVLVSSDSFTILTHEWRGKELSGGALLRELSVSASGRVKSMILSM
jgi:hypothetical protein